MRNLLNFFAKNSPFFLWLFLSIISIVLLCQNNPYHRSVWFGSANSLVGNVYDFQNNVTGYIGLREINEDLLHRAGLLEAENLALRQQLLQYRDEETQRNDTLSQYQYKIAHVVGNSIVQAENYITLDKGALDGITQDLGVADQNGVIGIVSKVSDHFSLVISLLNPKLRLSVMIKNNESFGSLVWDGVDHRHAILEDLPRSVKFEIGDTIVTTGYTSSFPKNLPVGRISESYDDGGSFLRLQVELFTDFNRINDVHIITNELQDERKTFEESEN